MPGSFKDLGCLEDPRIFFGGGMIRKYGNGPCVVFRTGFVG